MQEIWDLIRQNQSIQFSWGRTLSVGAVEAIVERLLPDEHVRAAFYGEEAGVLKVFAYTNYRTIIGSEERLLFRKQKFVEVIDTRNPRASGLCPDRKPTCFQWEGRTVNFPPVDWRKNGEIFRQLEKLYYDYNY